MNYELLFISGKLKNRTWRVPESGTLRIGAGKGCEITVPDSTASLFHCYVEMRDGKPWVGDLASDTGIVVNDVVVRECSIEVRDVIRIGNSEFKIVPATGRARSSGLGKMLPWLGMFVLGAAVVYLFCERKCTVPTTVTRVENETNVSNFVNIATVTNAINEVVASTNTVVKFIDSKGKGVYPSSAEQPCACPSGTKHLKACPCGGVGCGCVVVKPCKCDVGTMHRAPEKCPCDDAPNCACHVVAPAATADDFTLFFGAGVCKEAKQFERSVQANMEDMGKELALKKTSREAVAEAAFKIADRHLMDPYERFLYMKGSLILYARAICPREAMRIYQHIRFMLSDLDPRVAVELLELARKDVPDYFDPIMDRECARQRELVLFAATLEKLQAKPMSALTPDECLALADNAVVLGDLTTARKAMVSAGDKWKKIVGLEASSSATVTQRVRLGDFWWTHGEDKPALVRAAYRMRSAKCYVEALYRTKDKDAVADADRPRIENRIRTAYAEAEAAPYAGDDEYILVDLSGGPSAEYYPVRSINVEKFTDRKTGVVTWKDAYKTSGLVLKRVKPGTLESHGMKFQVTHSYYMGVFEVTQRQYELVMGQNPSWFGEDCRKPVEQVKYDLIRGKDLGRNWPMSLEVDEESFLGRLRRKTGLRFDLPTEIQWEYVCRAGTQGEYDGEKDSKAMDKLGRYCDNGGCIPDPEGTRDAKGKVKTIACGPAAVGSYRANAWGFYDLHGNIWEWCLDRYEGNGWVNDGYGQGDARKESVVDPFGGVYGSSRSQRGGGWGFKNYDCRASIRGRLASDGGWNAHGFRIVCPQGR